MIIALERGALVLGDDLPYDEVFLSVVSASELLHGVHRADSAQRRAARGQFVEYVLGSVTVVPIGLAIARTHSIVWADLAAKGQAIGAHDLWIAATGLTLDLPIATRNEREFSRVPGLQIVTLG